MKGILNKKGPLVGAVEIPGDKSITHRAIILSALGEGMSEIAGYLPSEDCARTIAAFREMGISVVSETKNGLPTLWVDGNGLSGLTEPSGVVDCGNSGTTLRLLAGLLAGQSFFSILTGDASLRSRPMRRVMDPLRRMGGEVFSRRGGYAPLAISGKSLSAIDYAMPIPSAQVKSAILLAGLFASGTTRIKEPRPSRDHTERMFRYFGVSCKETEGGLTIDGGVSYPARKILVPGDLSSAAFFLVAGLIVEGSQITLCRVGINPTRTGILDILQQMGAQMVIKPLASDCCEPVADITVSTSALHGVVIEGETFLRAIDEFPILCVAAALAEGETVIRGAEELRVKESDRIATMAHALGKMGVAIEEFPDGIKIVGGKKLNGISCETRGDHRIAMAMTIAGLVAEGGVKMDDVSCVQTSFPTFESLLDRLKER